MFTYRSHTEALAVPFATYFSIAVGLYPTVSAGREAKTAFIKAITSAVSVTMPGRRRTNQQSQVFKAKIARLKRQGKTNTEICGELGVSKQYVSVVLVRAGLRERRKRGAPKQPEDITTNDSPMIERLKQKGEQGLAEMLRVVLDRRPKGKKRTR